MSETTEQPSLWTRLRSGIGNRRRTLDRLANAISVLDEEHQIKEGKAGAAPAWAAATRRFLEKARAAQAQGNSEGGWAHLLEAERAEVEGLDEVELGARIVALKSEVDDKLRSWRLAAAKEILVRAEKEPDVGNKHRLVQEVLLLRNEHFQNTYRRIDILTTQLIIVGIILIVVLALILTDALDLAGMFGDEVPFDARLAAVFGLFGGTLSATWSLTRSDDKRKIPEQLRSFPITLLRPFMGAGAAVAVYVLLGAGAVSFMKGDAWAVAGLAFLSGFSEQLLFRVAASAGARAK